MTSKNVISILLNCHLPYINHADTAFHRDEMPLFQSISDTYIPFLQMLDRLDADRLPFRVSIVLSSTLAAMLTNQNLIDKYLRYVDKQIAFGETELERTKNKHNKALWKLARYYLDSIIEKKIVFTERYEKNIVHVFNYYREKGRMEILATMAAHNFIPFYINYPEAIQAQIEASLSEYKRHIGENPAGFWLPELGYAKGIDKFLRAYNLSYTIIDSHTAFLADPPADTGSFYPLRAPAGTLLLVRDYYAHKEIQGAPDVLSREAAYCDYFEDISYKLDSDSIKDFFDVDGIRCPSGYRYLKVEDKDNVYNVAAANQLAKKQARQFLRRRITALTKAHALIKKEPVSLCSWDADFLGRFWQEGFVFLETVIRQGIENDSIVFSTPSEYLCRQNSPEFQTISPDFSSAGINGYGESFLDKSNDWIYRHIFHAIERMIELAQRFNDDSGLLHRALNQAAREVLLAQTSDFARFKRTGPEGDTVWDEEALITHLRNFTTLYESLGGDYLSTKLLTHFENSNKIFPNINYRSFRKITKLKIEK